MSFEALARRAQVTAAPNASAGLQRRQFITFTGAGVFALAAAPAAHGQAADAAAPAKPPQAPGPFMAIAADGSITTTRMT